MQISVKAAIVAGLVAGAVFLALEMMLVMAAGMSPWGPPRMMAAMVMGEGVLPPPATFDFGIMAVAMAVHFAMAVILGFLFAALVGGRGLSFAAALGVGAVFGLAVYVFNFYVMTGVFPWFAMARNWNSIIAHAVFGIILALVYRQMTHHSTARTV